MVHGHICVISLHLFFFFFAALFPQDIPNPSNNRHLKPLMRICIHGLTRTCTLKKSQPNLTNGMDSCLFRVKLLEVMEIFNLNCGGGSVGV